jgi:hypothetical protein
MKPEPLLAELDRLRKDLDKDPTDIEWLALHHAFVFISYKSGEFAEYVKEASQRGEFDDYLQNP